MRVLVHSRSRMDLRSVSVGRFVGGWRDGYSFVSGVSRAHTCTVTTLVIRSAKCKTQNAKLIQMTTFMNQARTVRAASLYNRGKKIKLNMRQTP